MARLFVAVWPPDRTLDLLAELPRCEETGVRWTTREQWHVTLRFVGDADPDQVGQALTELPPPATRATVGPRLAMLGTQVLVAPVAGVDELAASVRGATSHLGDRPDRRPFVGHITLARLRGQGSCGLTAAAVHDEFEVTQVALVASETHPDGARYTTLAHVALEQS